MTSFQKIIKYGAIGFALYLCLTIISMIVFGVTAFFGITTGIELFANNSQNEATITKWEQEYTDIKKIAIDLSVCKLTIQKGETLKVEASDVSNQFICRSEGKELKVEDKKLSKNWFQLGNVAPEVILSIPEDIDLQEVTIETGVNEADIKFLKADKVKLEMGVGKYQIDQLIANYAKIKAGAGEAIIKDGNIEELKLEGGVGRLVFTSKIKTKADVSCGMGKVELNLLGTPQDYQIKTNTRIRKL